MLCKEQQVFQVFTPYRKLFSDGLYPNLRTITGLENRRVKWCKPSEDQSIVIQTADPNRSTLWHLIALLWRG